jgi:hypothetical protein
MTMTPAVRKLALTTHVTASVGWSGALAVFLAHNIVAVTSEDVQMVRAASLAMGLTAWFVILPLSLMSLVTGIVQALGTAWGLLRHYWVVVKLFLTVFATVVLLLKLAPISDLAGAAARPTFSRIDFGELKASLLIHAGVGLLVLLTITTLAIYKPAGLTAYGKRKLSEEAPNGGIRSTSGVPRWVQAFKIIALALAALFIVMMIHGGHGPANHVQLRG